MKIRAIFTITMVSIAALVAAACGSKSSGGGEAIKSTTAGDMTITISSPTGELRNGENDLLLTFADASGKPVDIEAASLGFHMPAMGSMPEMNDGATLTTTDTPGKFRAKVNIEMAGTWEAQIKYQGPQGAGQASMTVNAK